MRTLWIALLCVSTLVAADLPRPAQRFLLPDVHGKNHDSWDYKGRAMVLEFMATTCPHCAAFSKVLNQLQGRYFGRVAVVAVVNPPDTPEAVSAFITEHKVNYPILLDQGRVAYAYIRKPAFDIPYIFLIDANGQIREEFQFSASTQQIFEGNALFPHLDTLVASSFGAGKK